MAKFLTGNELNSELEKLFENAYEYILLISPYIKLHDRYASSLREKKSNPNIEIVVVFGKNEDDFSKSMKQEDFNFFKEFPNIEIRYERRLHAKYYANEDSSILTSMNLYSYSQDNNIEAGILTKGKSLLGNLTSNLLTSGDNFDAETFEYFERVIDQSDLLFKKVPQFDSAMFGLSKKYTSSIIETDKLSEFFSNKQKFETNNRRENNSYEKKGFVQKTEIRQKKPGYCIRTGVEIPFNPKYPMSDSAFQSWKKFGNPDYQEKYCHFSGEKSNGETSMSKPILRQNWSKAKEIHQL